MANPLLELHQHGQSVWYDNIDRAQLDSGQFKQMLTEDDIRGVTSNPTIFGKSISSGHAYDKQISELINEGKDTDAIYEAVVIQDIRTVADLLRPIYLKPAAYGHFGRDEPEFTWEATNKAEILRAEVGAAHSGRPAVQIA